MKLNKYRVFEVTLKDGSTFKTKSPASRLTEKYAKTLCWHWINKDHLVKDCDGITMNDIRDIKGIS